MSDTGWRTKASVMADDSRILTTNLPATAVSEAIMAKDAPKVLEILKQNNATDLAEMLGLAKVSV